MKMRPSYIKPLLRKPYYSEGSPRDIKVITLSSLHYTRKYQQLDQHIQVSAVCCSQELATTLSCNLSTTVCQQPLFTVVGTILLAVKSTISNLRINNWNNTCCPL